MIGKSFASAVLLAFAGAAFAQPQPGQTTPSVTPSETPAVTPSQSPAVTPSQSPAVTPSQSPAVTPSQSPSETPSQSPSVPPSQSPSAISPTAPRAVGGMSQCQNLIGADRDKCLQEERAATTGGTGAGTTAPR
jgi:hypothetical protein